MTIWQMILVIALVDIPFFVAMYYSGYRKGKKESENLKSE